MSDTVYSTFFPQIHHIQVPKLGAQIEGNVGTRKQYLIHGRGYQTPVSMRLWNDEEKRAGYIEDARILADHHRTIGVRHVKRGWELWGELWSSPPHHDHLLDYAEQLCEIIGVLKPDAVELGNEANVGTFAARTYEHYFGAWIWDEDGRGDASAAGVLYRKMLEVVYPYVKARYPNVEIIAGALMANEHTEDFLRSFKDGPCDSVSFHKYLGITEDFEELYNYVQRLRKITKKRLVMTETSIVATMDGDGLKRQQELYMRWIIENWERLGLHRVSWYTLGDNGGYGAAADGGNLWGWMCSDMCRNGDLSPAYHAWKGALL